MLQGFSDGKQNPVTAQWIGAYGAAVPDELDDVDVGMSAALAPYMRLPIDPAWFARADLRRHALLAGWPEAGVASDRGDATRS